MANKVIKHGLFTYYVEKEGILADGTRGDRLVEKIAYHGQEVDIPREVDIQRGEENGAFFNDAELKVMRRKRRRAESRAEVEAAKTVDETDFEELDDEELVEWLMSAGQFDGEKKPNADTVVKVAEGDPELAERLIKAEETASGGSPRSTVIDGLTAIRAAGGGSSEEDDEAAERRTELGELSDEDLKTAAEEAEVDVEETVKGKRSKVKKRAALIDAIVEAESEEG